MTGRMIFRNRAEWLAGRQKICGIGASEAAAAAGESKRLSRIDLWKIKTGQVPAPDLSDNELVQRGIRMEGAIRGWFEASHPELRIRHRPFDIVYQIERPWLFATLDAETIDRKTGELGVVEIKTAQPRNRAEWEIWDRGVPNDYYSQVLHQHLATKRRCFWLIAALYRTDGDVVLREYGWTADDGFVSDAEWLLGQEELFMDYVNRRIIPPVPLKI